MDSETQQANPRDGRSFGAMLVRWLRIAGKACVLGVCGLLLGMFIHSWLLPLLPDSWTARLKAPGVQQEGTGRGEQSRRKVAFWKSSMIPNFVSPRPGKDPMGMDLVPVYVDELGEEKLITLSDAVTNNMGLRTVPVQRESAQHVVRTIGRVDYAEPLLGDVTLKVGGWVEELLVDFVGQRVEKGQPLFSFYSPELVTAEEEYLITLPNETASPPARDLRTPRLPVGAIHPYEKLRYWDVPDSEIERVKQAGVTQKTLTFQSPFDGWVIEKHALEGMHMDPGERFYRIADLRTMWVYATVYEYQLPIVREGESTRLTLPYEPGKTYEGRVDYVYPYVNPQTREIQVRLEFPNPDLDLKPEMYADVEIGVPTGPDRLLVPLDAVIDRGRQKKIDGVSQHVGFAYVEVGHGRFEPREVALGEEVQDGRLETLSGLNEGEQVVVSGQFQLDSERRIKEANMRMLSGQ